MTSAGAPKPTAKDVAQWMLEEFKRQAEWLGQDDAAASIERLFGPQFVYQNDRGNLAISKEVLKEFRALTPDDVVWDRSERAWRRRESGDGKGRQSE